MTKAHLYGRVIDLGAGHEFGPTCADQSVAADIVVALVQTLPTGLPTVALAGGILGAFDERLILVSVPPDCGPLLLEHSVVDHLVPMALTLAGDFVVHGAAVARDETGLLFLGESGAGKSTTSAGFTAAGWRPLGDDAIRIELTPTGPRMWPSYEGFRLHGEALSLFEGVAAGSSPVVEAASKRRIVGIGEFVQGPAALTHLVLLGASTPERTLSPLGPAARTSWLARSAFHPPISNLGAVDLLHQAAGIAERIDGRVVTYPRIEGAIDWLLETLAFDSTSACAE